MRYAGMWVSFVVVLAVAGQLSAEEATVKAENLVGEWAGEWTHPVYGRGAIRITIKKASEDGVEGTSFIEGSAAYHNREYKFVGTLVKNTLSARSTLSAGFADYPTTTWELQISKDGTKMDGYAETRAKSSVSLTKKH